MSVNKLLQKKEIKWERPNQFSNFQNYCIFYKNEPDINNIKQGILQNSNFLSALGALCDKDKNYVKKLFYNTEKSYEHVYGINLIINGKPKIILIDDYFPYIPLIDNKTKTNTKNYALASSYQNEIWVSLLEKVYAKVKGTYCKLENYKAKEAFEFLTGAYTEEIDITKVDCNSLWNYLMDHTDFPICSMTKEKAKGSFKTYGLKPLHGYTLLKLSEKNNIKKVLLRDSYGTDNIGTKCENVPDSKGMFWISYNDFIKFFQLIEIAYFKPNFLEYYIKITKEEAKKCQVIKIINENEGNSIYLNLYQKNIKNNKINNFYSYMMLVEKTEQKHKFIFSKTSFYNEKQYKNHIEKNSLVLNKGTYYLFCDINYRYFKEVKKNHGYCLRIFSTQELKYEKIPEDMKANTIKIFQESIINMIKSKKEVKKIKDQNLNKISLQIYKNIGELPFDAFLLKNEGKNMTKIVITIKDKMSSLYNDDVFKDTDKRICMGLNPEKEKLILIMNYNYGKPNVIKKISDIKNIAIEIMDTKSGHNEDNISIPFIGIAKKIYDGIVGN